MAAFRGLTWDHPRGYNALAAAAHGGDLVHWDKQPLEGFESAPIGDICAAYDLVVLDHPHLGEALARQCLLPLDSVLPKSTLTQIASQSIGRSFESYEMAGRQFALPLDAATQVMAYRCDLMREPVTLWSDVVARAEQRGDVALCLAGPHAILSLMSIASALEADLDMRNASAWMSTALCEEAYSLLQSVYLYALRGTETLNPIAMLQAMSSDASIAVCPLIYGYVNYCRPPEDTVVRFADAPKASIEGRAGSILGGTGIAISHRTAISDQLVEHLSWLLSSDTQATFIPQHDGQPSARSAWHDTAVNRAASDFYAATSATLETATIRPRFDGYIAFQSEASAMVRAALADGQPAAWVSDGLAQLFNKHHSKQESGA